MALTVEEKQFVQEGKANGMSLLEVKAALARSRATQTSPGPQSQDAGVARGAQGLLDTVFGGGRIGDAIGTQIAKGGLGTGIQRAVTGRDIPASEEALVEDGPSGAQVAGDVARAGSNFLPVGRIAGLASKGLRAIGLNRGVSTASNILAGGATGAALDVSEDVRSGQDVSLGGGTVVGAGLPAAAPVAQALSRVTSRVLGRGTSEVGGALTGTSAETLEEAFQAASRGGDDLERFTDALRGKTTPEALVDTFRGQISTVSSRRQTLFRETLDELGDSRVPTGEARQNFLAALSDAGISYDVTKDALDFAGSKLRAVPNAQSKIRQAWSEVSSLSSDASLKEIDTARQAIKALTLTGDDASANLGNKLVDDAVRSVREVGEDVPGYGQMLDEFAETSEFLDELSRGLVSGDKATIDQTYRRMATSLRTNNEQRMALVRELDQLTDGAILSQISGQQLSEVLPRGIFRQISAGLAGGAVLTGGLTPSLIPALVFASPRVAGEFVRALGIGAQKAKLITKAIADARSLLIKAGAVSGTASEPGNN